MAQMPAVCSTCSVPVNAVFDPSTGTRDSAFLTAPLFVTEQCFVRDTIEFHNGGQIVFRAVNGRYFSEYNVICRKLIVTGGSSPNVKLNPCGPDDPGKNYSGNNVITWEGRLQTAPHGGEWGSAAKDGMPPPPNDIPFDPNAWKDLGQGNNGMNGLPGENGNKGNPGGNGANALNVLDTRESRPVLNVVALELVFTSMQSYLTIDWNGQTGGNAGKGQNGGRGGDGMGGRDGLTDTDWADSCERQPGNGGNTGSGGAGGDGGSGGNGGSAGDIFIISTVANVSAGVGFKGGQVTYVNGGGGGGSPGAGGRGGQAGLKAGNKGAKTSECDEANDGVASGQPGADSTAPQPAGSAGNPGNLRFEVIAPPASGTCADLIPAALRILSIAPNSGAKGSAVAVVITGAGFDAAAPANNQVLVSGPGVAVGALAVTATTITCNFTINNLTLASARDVTVTVGLTNSTTVAGGFTVV